MKIIPGIPNPLGFSMRDKKSNFALFSSHAEKVTLSLFDQRSPINTIPMNRTGDIWHVGIEDLPENLEYVYFCEGPQEQLYKPNAPLLDPYAKIVRQGRAVAAIPAPFDWQKDAPPRIPKEDLIIYEMHVRGFTKHPSSQVAKPGTYLGMIEKIPHLKKLGVNAVELMPIFGFDADHLDKINPNTKQKLVNYWGYNPLHYFSPTSWYADQDSIFEFKTLVRELHKNGIEVFLDVVYNHTGEENNRDYYVHFRGIDNSVYYLLDEKGEYLNYSGCWNTLATGRPIVQKLVLDSLHYWVQEMHVDGFRFDLASILTRNQTGRPLTRPPLIEAISQDPILKEIKLIAEPWDAAGLYQLGSFPKWGPWSEWNGKYRDIVRRFIKGSDNEAGNFANVISGSALAYKTPLSSINFITAHDGFTLRDLVSYDQKHNFANGEHNQDGSNLNDSWNCGVEGETEDPQILQLRERQMRNFLLTLFLSQGIPMLFMGDEYGHTRMGNNNPYGQDNELNWFLWDQLDEKKLQFISSLIAFRQQHPQFRHTSLLTDAEVNWETNWDAESRLVVYQFKKAPSFYIAFNANFEPAKLTLPNGNWQVIVNTEEDWLFHTNGPNVNAVELLPYSALLVKAFATSPPIA